MEFSAKQIASFIGGKIEGDENATVHTFAKIEEGVPGAISFLSNPKYTHHIYDTESSIVLVNENVELTQPVKATLIRVKMLMNVLPSCCNYIKHHCQKRLASARWLSYLKVQK